MADVLVDDAPHRLRRLAVVGGGLLVAVVAGSAALRSTLPPRPLEVRLAGMSGSALAEESFVRLHFRIEQSGARGLEEAVLTVAGTTSRGQHLSAFDDDDHVTVQVDVVPACGSLPDVGPGVLDLRLRDASGNARRVRLGITTDGQLERLVRYRCT